MILSRSKPATETNTQKSTSSNKTLPELDDFLLKRDYIGALTLLEFLKSSGEKSIWLDVWVAFCCFHLGDYNKSLETYKDILKRSEVSRELEEEIKVNLAVCYFYLGMYNESHESIQHAEDSPLKNRLLFHLAFKLGEEDNIMEWHKNLRDVPEDQLCLASIHYLRGHYQEAIDVYKKLLLDKRTYLALNVYVALCYYKLDYYDVSQEVLSVYLNHYPNSTVAVNLKACNLFRLYNGKAAENELKSISSEQHTFGQDLVKHNLVVFRSGEGALKVLPPLLDVVAEARLNLAAWRLRHGEPQEAAELLDTLTPQNPLHYILRAVLSASLYNITGDDEKLKVAAQSFQLVGSSASECDTIPGRQCMASTYFLAGQFEESLVYLNSIKSFFVNDDTFNFNYAQAKVATGAYREAEDCLLNIQDETLRTSYTYTACLARCYIMNKQPQHAWELCVKSSGMSYCISLLQLVANDCYRMGHFLVAARAFHMLDRLEPNPELWEGLRGACAGAIQQAVANLQDKPKGGPASASQGTVREVIGLLRSATHAASMLRHVLRWANQARIVV